VADFRGYLCWEPETATTTISTEAVSPSSAVFLATHTPLRIRQARIQGRGIVPMEAIVDEDAVLRDFLERQPDTGTLLMPVIGDSGSGKSHLVRWVKERMPDSDTRRVIYLEKARTSLRAVVETLLDGVQDKRLDRLRDDIHSFTTSMDPEALARRLINALNEALAATTPRGLSGDARMLAGPRGLAALVQDPHIQEYMLQPDKFIPQFATRMLEDRGEGTPERAPSFTVDDLPLKVRDIEHASRVSGILLRHLLSKSALCDAAVTLLNEHWEAAVKSVSSLTSGRLHEAMLQVREAYADRGKEIVLLIEDFALIQGVQRDLLDAITEAAHRDGRSRYARMRTLMAVTPGYFRDHLPETALTRVAAATSGYVYDLDVPFSKEDSGKEAIASFVGRYLNAARIGRAALERHGAGKAPNPCDSCPFKGPCHEGFGVTDDGHGLYPFNRDALVRMVHSVAPKEQPWAFVPRTVLGSIVRPILIEHATALAEGAFPEPRFRELFPIADQDDELPTNTSEIVDDEDKLDGARRKLVLEFWADAPDDPNDVPRSVLDGFALPPLSLPGGSADRTRKPARTPGRRDRATTNRSVPAADTDPDAVPQSMNRKLDLAEQWAARGKTLPQAEAREMRTIVVDAILRRYHWQDPPMQEQGLGVLRDALPAKSTSVSIEGAGGENLVGTDRAPVKFSRKAADSQFFQSLFLISHGVGHPRSEDVRRLASVADRHADAVTAALRRSLGTSDSELVLGLRASLLGAALAGRAAPTSDDTELLSAALDDGRDWSRADIATRVPAWTQALERHLHHRAKITDTLRSSFGIAQGSTGAVRMIDAARALPLLREASATWEWSPDGSLPGWIPNQAVGGFATWGRWVDEQAAVLRTRLAEIRERLPAGVSGPETAAAVEAALKEATKVGLVAPLSRDEAIELRELLSRLEGADWRVVAALEEDLRRVDDADRSAEERRGALITAVVRDRGAALDDIVRFLTLADQWLDAALAQAAARSDSLGDAAAQQVKDVLAQWTALTGREGGQSA
jgi:hypothetical protein